jgi:2'-5' RNA ligase
MKRTFFAVDIHPDEKLTGVLQDIRDCLAGENIKWVTTDSMHLTLKFLGDTPEDSIRQIIGSVDPSLRTLPFIELHLYAVGLFKNLHNPRVIWIGIRSCPALEQAVHILTNAMVSFGYPAETVEFVPHLTLGRVKECKQTEKLSRLVKKYENESFGKVNIREVIYYESMLKPEGPFYHPLARFPLRG